MNINTLLKVIENIKGGQFHSITWEKQLKTYKGINDTVTKRTTSVLRIGVSYDHKKAVIEKRENGELPSENQGLPYGKWHIFPYVIEHKENYQLRLTTAENTKFNTKYFLNGEEVNKADIQDIVLASEIKSSDNMIDVFNVKIENIITIA